MNWIKIRTTLPSDPRVIKMAEILKRPQHEILGALVTMWVFFDTHSTDGSLQFSSRSSIDAEVKIDGFCSALHRVGWLDDMANGGVSIPRFAEHNGASAKFRSENAARQAKFRVTGGKK